MHEPGHLGRVDHLARLGEWWCEGTRGQAHGEAAVDLGQVVRDVVGDDRRFVSEHGTGRAVQSIPSDTSRRSMKGDAWQATLGLMLY